MHLRGVNRVKAKAPLTVRRTTMEKIEITSLVKQAAQGDAAAFGKLYEATGRKIYFAALKLTGSDADAQDVLQDTFMTAYQKLGTLSEPENFEAWLMRIAVNRCKMQFRAQKPTTDEPEVMENIEDEGLIPEDYVMDRAKRKVIMDIIDRELTEDQRRTVVLFYYSQLSVEEIASVMGCPKGTVLSRLHLARGKIREAVLIYENKSGDKLHALIPIPVLTRIFEEEAGELTLPELAVTGTAGAASAAVAKSGGKVMVNTAKTRLIAGIAAGVVAAGGIGTAVILSSSNDDDTDSRSSTSSIVIDESSIASSADISELISDVSSANDSSENIDERNNNNLAQTNDYVDQGQALVNKFFTALKEGDADTILECLYKPEKYKSIAPGSECREAAMEVTKYIFSELEWDLGGDGYRKTNRKGLEQLKTSSKIKSADFRVSYVTKDMHLAMSKYISTLNTGDAVTKVGPKAGRDVFYKYADAVKNVTPLQSNFIIRLRLDENGEFKVDGDSFCFSAVRLHDTYLWELTNNTPDLYYSRLVSELFDTDNTGHVVNSGAIGQSSNPNSCPTENAYVVDLVREKHFDKAYDYLMNSENPVIREYLNKNGCPLKHYEKLTDEQKQKVMDYIRKDTVLTFSDYSVDKYQSRYVQYLLYYNDPTFNAEDYLSFKGSHKSYTSISAASSFREGNPKDLFELLKPLDDIALFANKL